MACSLPFPLPINSGPAEGTKGNRKKRKFDIGEEKSGKNTLKVNFPGELKKTLVDDWENINRNQKVMKLPVEPCVRKILDYYVNNVVDGTAKDAKQIKLSKNVVDALKIYFEHSLGRSLLYAHERETYESQVKSKKKNPLDMYGVYHLLRLFVKMPSLVNNTGLTEEQQSAIGKEISNICGHIVKNKAHLFLGEYTTQTKTLKSEKSMDLGTRENIERDVERD
eukprot:CAMPEP_0184503478 /NCGR_PEP_ID=MMETSP0113_2-20130426/51915_1 /TAXON_ID=91329 /ORGANISM="Norrisiella sphaerica, Strain BC52" /LENGTH=222 /DNA_ID=CAMNT_0026892981 /DNA_START=576 /DNA_END=1244 /DNA_ORIENTATION=-